MTQETRETLDRALKLPLDERAYVAQRLFESLASESEAHDPEVERAWREEIARRALRVLDGEPGIPWEEVRARIDAQFW